MREFRLAGVFVAALAGAALTVTWVEARSADLPGFFELPLVFLMGGIASAVTAAWAANLLAGTDTRTQLLPATAFTAGIALLAALGLLSITPLLAWSETARSWVGTAVIALAATGGASGYRTRRRGTMAADAVTSLIILGLIPLVMAGVVWTGPRVTEFFGRSGRIELSDREETWCAENRGRVLEVARAMGSEALPDPGDDAAMLEWRAREPRRYFAACQTAYQGAH